ncbi:hypothetical protein EDB86DRAFT_2840993 [Lactarius hatsudake]|nr:hypothetical protein EDB86DRAFT_2840993 [Lactarius hatsudake]
MDFNSIADAELLFQDMVDGNVHLVHEATVGAIGLLCKNSRFYSAKLFLISGSCKRETAEDHAKLIQTALNAIKTVNTLSNARVVSIASDGEAKRGKALVLLTFKRKLSPSSPIYPWLSGCALLDLHVGDDDITCDKDWKHAAAKRPRNALLREKGILVHGTWITPALLRSHLLEAGHKPQHVHAVLNPNDKQDVLLAYTLLQDIWSLPRLTSGAPGCIKARDSLHLFGSMCSHFLMPYICVDLSIREQLEYLSYAAHLALVLYVHEKACNDFIPTALYVDLIMMVKNVFFCAAKAKVDTPNDDFSIVLLGTDRLENLFGCLRTIIGNDANVDNYQLGSRLTGTMESANILAMHPEWDKAPASQALSSLTPPTVWIRGRRKLEADHPFVCDVLRAVEEIPDATLLAPFGTLLVHASLPGDDVEDPSHDDEDAVLSDHPNVPLTGEGMCELEDTATSLDWAPDQHSFGNVVVVDDNTGTLNKSRALSLLFKYSKSTSSTDRLRRVQQEARFVQSEPATLVDDASDDLGNVLMVNNPIASLVSCEENIFLCIGEIIGIHLGSKSVDYLRLDALSEDTVHITYQVCSLVCTSPDDNKHDDDALKYDWKTQHLLPIKFKVPGNLIQPINPSLAMPPSCAPFYLFETPTLVAFASSLRDRLTNPQLKSIPQTLQTDRFPYRERSGEACFVAEALYNVRESSMHKCPACTPPVQLDATNGQRIDITKHEDLWKITPDEATAMAAIWKNRRKQPNYIAREDESIHDDKQDSDVMEEDLGGNEDSAEEDNVNEMVVEADGERKDGQSGSNGADGSGGCASVPNSEKYLQSRSDCVDSREGVKGLEVVDGRGKSAIGGVSVGLVAESNERAPEHSDLISTAATNVGVPASPPAHASLTTERLAGTEDDGQDDGSLLRDAQVSSFGRKRKLHNMHDISACLCGRSAALSAGRKADDSDSLCCRVAGCETKWYHLTCVGLSSPPRNWTCEGHAYVKTPPPCPHRPYEKNRRLVAKGNYPNDVGPGIPYQWGGGRRPAVVPELVPGFLGDNS